MIKPNIPNIPNIPGMGAMTDTLDFVKNLWGSMGLPGMNVPGMQSMNLPGMVMPTLSVDEINKKISDLKAVETWLNLNMGMLRSTIQALEVQAATISTLQTMGERFSATMNPAGQDSAQSASAASDGAKGNGASGTNGSSHGTERVHAPPPEPTTKDEQDAASLTAPLVNAAAWWNMLQDQFKQAVNTAMQETQAVAAAATAPVTTEKPKAKSSAKPKASSSSASSSSSSASGTARKRKTSK